MYPEQPEFKNNAENKVFQHIKEHLPDSYICYFNYYINNREFDIAILIPGSGVFILEVKGWSADQIYRVQDNNCILTKNSKGHEVPWQSPLKQVNDYRFSLIRKIEKELNKDILVVPIVCYPNILKKEYKEKRLDIVSPEGFTIFKDDFQKDDSLMKRLKRIADGCKNFSKDKFNLENMVEVRRFFESEEQINKTLYSINIRGEVASMKSSKREYYSYLLYLPSNLAGLELDKLMKKVVDYWSIGTKIYFFSNSPKILSELKIELHKKLVELNLHKKFEKSTFNFFLYEVQSSKDTMFDIFNGEVIATQKYREELKAFHSETNFNLDQFEVEHAPCNEHISIKAGAGSGKTFSMISRINYLIYAHKLTAENLKETIYLITFTNEAATNMKTKLQDYFHNYYLITRDYEIFRLIESIEEMKITTIHSLAKKILKEFSAEIGLGNDVRIVTGKYERDQILAKELDTYIKGEVKTQENLMPSLRLSMFNLLKRLQNILQKLENKNMDVINDPLDFGKSEIPALGKVIQEVLPKTENKMRSSLESNNTIRLSDLMIKLKKLVNENHLDLQRYGIKYLFVDEFQDTDDVQIELMKSFQSIMNFNFFIVGDIKQCIYRFRGAEDKAFDKLENYNLKSFSLNKNYRSDSRLLKNFEKRFKKWGGESRLAYDMKDDELVSHIKLNQNDTCFKKVKVNKGEDIEDQQSFEQSFIKELELEYNNLSTKGTLAILVRENSEIDKIRELGLRNGYFIETDSGGDLYQLDPTIDFYKVILALQNPTSPRHLFNLYTSNYVSEPLIKKELYANKNNSRALLQLFHKYNPIENWSNYVDELKREPVLYVLRRIILDTRPWEVYSNERSKEGKNLTKIKAYYKRNLDQLFEKLTTIGEQDYLTINKIENYLKIMILTKQKEESRESFEGDQGKSKRIICMTVHKSKGLEFETVFLPFPNNDLKDNKKSGILDLIVSNNFEVGYKMKLDEKFINSYYTKNDVYKTQWESEIEQKVNEETRILYVALTRTEKQFVYFYYEDLDKRLLSWQKLLEE
ncbi:UvrD-helicase domain-containing protein [Halobacillus trueperi]|uniref:UvrD-helicase domain-containing protein n=1 Tax=Halobacillus trueperi TaxID=156205 RepID=UPI003734C7B5